MPASLEFRRAGSKDVRALAQLQRRVADDLCEKYGEGHWSRPGTEHGVLRRIRESYVLVASCEGTLAGSLTLQKKKPWAIERAFLTDVERRWYLVSMAVAPALQRSGVGRGLLDEVDRLGRLRGIQAIALDAYDAPSGAGGFYAKCGYREIGRKVYRGVPLIYFERLLI